MFEYHMNMAETVGFAIVLLLLGRWIKRKVNFFEKFFIPAPVIGGTLFSIILLIGHQTGTFSLETIKPADGEISITDLLMIAFFTTVGFSASLKLLKKSGRPVVLFLFAAVALVVLQNIVGTGLAKTLGINPLLGLAAGSIPLTGGHGTAASLAPGLEDLGAAGAKVVAIASATYGLISGCIIGGPIARRLMLKNDLKSTDVKDEFNVSLMENKTEVTEERLFSAVIYISIAMGIGATLNIMLNNFLSAHDIKLKFPAYLFGMVVAAIIRNALDFKQKQLPFNEIGILGNISLSLFLSMALMSMKLWQLIDLALPLIIILAVQTVVMALYAYYVTFSIMGRDYDAAVIATGHCGFGLGATANAIANMEAFTNINGPSQKAFFVIPIVGSLFIDFINALVIQGFSWGITTFM